jgi:uridine kinase
MIIIGICGASGSGKSTLAREIKASLTCNALILGMDCYYKDHSSLPLNERMRINYDEPGVFDYDELYQDLLTLEDGRPIRQKGYDYSNHVRADTDQLIYPPDVLILEGIHMFWDGRITKKMVLRVYMHVDVDICLLRRIKRDIRARGRSIESISEQYMETVKPMYEEYISKYIRDADFAVMHGGKNRLAIDAIAAYLSTRLLAETFEREQRGRGFSVGSPPDACPEVECL